MEVRAEARRASICQARDWDRSLILAPYIAVEVVKTNYVFCKWMGRWEIEAKINVNVKSVRATNGHECATRPRACPTMRLTVVPVRELDFHSFLRDVEIGFDLFVTQEC